MLTTVTIKNFQSLKDVTLTLQRFSVIVGPSSSGKSAFTRALRTLTSNQRGDSFITHGENQCSIIAKTDRGTVALQRGKKNEYTLIPEDESSQQKTFTKLAGNTPEEVSEFIGIPAKDPLNYANQFDMPYLLTSSASEVARTLGELTNVSVIFEAAREANRQRLQASSTLKTRAKDYDDLTINLDKYKTLKEDIKQIEQAEEALTSAKKAETRISRLKSLITSIESIPTIPEPRDIPDISSVTEQYERLKTLRTLVETITRTLTDYKQYAEQVEQYADTAEQAQAEYYERLAVAGKCPTCGQGTESLAHKH